MKKIAVLRVLLHRVARVFGVPEDLETEFFAELGVEAVFLGVFQGNFTLVVVEFFDHEHVLEEVNLTGDLVELCLELTV